MLNINKVEHIYLAVEVTDLRKSIDGLSAIVGVSKKLNVYDNAPFVFCNRRTKEELIANLPIEEVHHELQEDELICEKCAHPLMTWVQIQGIKSR